MCEATPSSSQSDMNQSDNPEYVYHDYSTVDRERILFDNNHNVVELPMLMKTQRLPIKLASILSDTRFSDVISWMPHGRSWRVLRPKLFVSDVMPKYFEYNKYDSFIRLVNAWGFRRVKCGIDQGSYYHEVSYHASALKKVYTCSDIF